MGERRDGKHSSEPPFGGLILKDPTEEEPMVAKFSVEPEQGEDIYRTDPIWS